MSYCTYSDCDVVYEDFSSMVGTTGTSIIADASAWVQATLLDFYGSVYFESGTVYPFWVRKATALQSVYLALDRRMRQAQQATSGFWTQYTEDAQKILSDIRDNKHVLSTQEVAPWERNIAPATPVANGTVSPPAYGQMFSNSDIPGAYWGGDHPVVYVVELDGAGSRISQQTFRWQYKYGSVWNQSTIPLSWEWTSIDLGMYVRFEDSGTFVAGQRWEIQCAPGQGRTPHGDTIRSWQMSRSF